VQPFENLIKNLFSIRPRMTRMAIWGFNWKII